MAVVHIIIKIRLIVHQTSATKSITPPMESHFFADQFTELQPSFFASNEGLDQQKLMPVETEAVECSQTSLMPVETPAMIFNSFETPPEERR